MVLATSNEIGTNYTLLDNGEANTSLNLKLTILSFEKEKKLELLFKKRLLYFDKYPLFWKAFRIERAGILKTVGFLQDNLRMNRNFDENSLQNLGNVKRIVLFDAYSNKISKKLWSESFLENLMAKCKKGSLFTTYAATGVLNRTLRKSRFKNLKRKGFLYKRESTLAIKI